MVTLPDVPGGGLMSLPPVGGAAGVTMSTVGAADAPAPTLEPTALPLALGLPPDMPGRVSCPPKPGTRDSGMGDWANAPSDIVANVPPTRTDRTTLRITSDLQARLPGKALLEAKGSPAHYPTWVSIFRSPPEGKRNEGAAAGGRWREGSSPRAVTEIARLGYRH
jgi:hypothetical protein